MVPTFFMAAFSMRQPPPFHHDVQGHADGMSHARCTIGIATAGKSSFIANTAAIRRKTHFPTRI
jgi:hypothetical protein